MSESSRVRGASRGPGLTLKLEGCGGNGNVGFRGPWNTRIEATSLLQNFRLHGARRPHRTLLSSKKASLPQSSHEPWDFSKAATRNSGAAERR